MEFQNKKSSAHNSQNDKQNQRFLCPEECTAGKRECPTVRYCRIPSSSEDTGRSPERAAGALSSPVGERAVSFIKGHGSCMAISASRAAVSRPGGLDSGADGVSSVFVGNLCYCILRRCGRKLVGDGGGNISRIGKLRKGNPAVFLNREYGQIRSSSPAIVISLATDEWAVSISAAFRD